MWFLIKAAFWFSLVLVLLPIFSTESTSRLEGDPRVQFSDAFSAVTGTYEYVSDLCREKPDVCLKGAETFTALGYRAREGARVAYEFLDNKFGDAKPADKIAELSQPMPVMPEKPIATSPQTADAVVTGTVSKHGAIPVPQPKPAI